ncbi:hypothetical protein [Halorubellus salinus]|uniref:hypothetical protein n=1 Tax=Halorubellus salinus TaxID=755309 RepID=UPI001D06DE98|nr:hypothetical protein [Halorubellus salinus]
MRRRSLLATVGSTAAVGLAGCTLLDPDREVDDGDTVALDAGDVTLGWLGVQSSFVDDTSAPATAYGAADAAFVVLDCDLRAYDAPVDDLPIAVELDRGGVRRVSDPRISGLGDDRPRLGFRVPTGEPLESGAVVLEDAEGRERRYPFPERVREPLATPASWRVDVDAPDTIAAPGSARAWTTATNTGDTAGRLAAVLTHDAADDLYWTHTYDAPGTGDETYGYRLHCLCGDAEELTITLDWGVDEWTGVVSVEP